MENILVAVDFSTSSKNAAMYAANLAGYFGAKLTLFHSYHVPSLGFEAGYLPPFGNLESETKQELKNWVDWLSKNNKGVDIGYRLEMGFAADLIENMAKENESDIIVLGFTGQNNFIKEHILGSVASRVAETSRVPVLIVPEHVKFKKIKKIAYACDLDRSLETNNTIMKVKYFCSLFDADLQILNVIRPDEEISIDKAATDSYVEEKLYTTRHDTFFIYNEKVDKGLIQFMEHHESDILITCPKTHNFFHNLFVESNTKKLVFHSNVPILAIHE